MVEPNRALFWRRGSAFPLVAMGLLASLMTLGLSLQKGMLDGYGLGLQSLETGQAQILSPQGKIVPYFMARTLAENLQGVVAASSRLDFLALVSTGSDPPRLVHIRACNFAQETKVTGWAGRVTSRGPQLVSGLILSRELGQDPRWAGALTLTLSDPDRRFPTTPIRVSGTVSGSGGRPLDQIVYLDLGSALRLLGPETSVTAIALRLRAGIDPERWVDEHRNSFRNFGLTLQPWKTVFGPEILPLASVVGGPASWMGGLVIVAASALVMIGLGSRKPRSGLSLVLRGDRREWFRALGVLGGTFILATVLLGGLVSWAHPWIFGEMERDYPFVGTAQALWSWDPGLLVPPVLTVAAAFAAVLWVPPPGGRR